MSQALALRPVASPASAGSASSAAASTKAPVQEARLFELVKMICDWVERSFTPQQEQRMKEKGRLYARFNVDLGKEMLGQLQAYVGASFKLKLLKFRAVQRDVPGKKAPRECVEVVMSPEARDLYAQKCPDAVNKYRLQLEKCEEGNAEGGLVDADGDEGAEGSGPPLAIESGLAAAVPGERRALTDGQVDPGSAATPSNSKRVRGADTPEGALAKAPRRSRGLVMDAVSQPQTEAGVARATEPGAGGSTTGSIWEKVEAQEVPTGSSGLTEARDALESALARTGGGGIGAIKAEKELVAWLKGLKGRLVSGGELKDTKIGLVVNQCRKHSEPYISELAVSILAAWKKAWREGEKGRS